MRSVTKHQYYILPQKVARIGIRPERMRVASRIGERDNVVRGAGSDLIYFGDHVRMRCAIADQNECFVKVPLGNDVLSDFASGKPVSLAFAPEHLRVFA